MNVNDPINDISDIQVLRYLIIREDFLSIELKDFVVKQLDNMIDGSEPLLSSFLSSQQAIQSTE